MQCRPARPCGLPGLVRAARAERACTDMSAKAGFPVCRVGGCCAGCVGTRGLCAHDVRASARLCGLVWFRPPGSSCPRASHLPRILRIVVSDSFTQWKGYPYSLERNGRKTSTMGVSRPEIISNTRSRPIA